MSEKLCIVISKLILRRTTERLDWSAGWLRQRGMANHVTWWPIAHHIPFCHLSMRERFSASFILHQTENHSHCMSAIQFYLFSASDQDEVGWKIIHADVFRFPPYKSWLCAILGKLYSSSSILWHLNLELYISFSIIDLTRIIKN